MQDRRSLLLSLIIIIPSLFLLFLSAVLSRTVLTPLILLVLLAVGLGVLSRVKPELFERFKKPEEPAADSVRSVPHEPIRYGDAKKTYLELACVNASGGKNIIMDKTPFTVGRGQGNDFITDNPEVSTHHLRLEYREEDHICFVIDLNSTNFTYLNTEKLPPNKPRSLRQGDLLQIANEAYQVEYAHF